MKSKKDLIICPKENEVLSRTQLEFNRLMKSLESVKAKHTREESRLDKILAISSGELMPLVEALSRANRDLVLNGFRALKTIKLTAKRRLWFKDLLSGKASDLLADPVGLSAEEIADLENVINELGDRHCDPRVREDNSEEFDMMRQMFEQVARKAGIDLDLSDLDSSMDPDEFERLVHERLQEAADAMDGQEASAQNPEKNRRQPTKAQVEKEHKLAEYEEAKNRDLKSFFKQLAKAFHPDLEPDPIMKEHKEIWMKRLNMAYEKKDLREMLQLEMEWLGEEATNLTSAGDDKLKIYCSVLKEQIADLKRQTRMLINEPQYGTLWRFRDAYSGIISNPRSLKLHLEDELRRHLDFLQLRAIWNSASGLVRLAAALAASDGC